MLVTPGLTWKEAVEKAKAREIDVLPCVGMTEERKKFFNYTQPYLAFYRVIITHRDGRTFDNLENLKGLRVAIQENSSHHGFLKDNSDLEPLLFSTAEETLLAVSEGRADAAIGNEAVTAYTINKNSIINLALTRIAGTEAKSLYLAVRNDWPELTSLLNKGLDSITPEEKEIIRKKWIAIQVERRIDYILVAKVAGFALLFALLLFLWNMQIRRQKELLQVSEARFRSLSDASFEGIVLHENGAIIDINQKIPQMFGYSSQELIGRNIIEFLPEEYHQIVANRINQDTVGFYEIEGIRKDGSRFPMEVHGKTMQLSKGRNVRISAARDITERKRMENALLESLRDKEMLISEINHRVKNNLLVIQNLIKLHSVQIADQEAQGAFRDIESRISSISIIHERLSYASSQTDVNFREYIQSLATQVFNTYQVDAPNVRLSLDVPDVTLDVDTVMPCGLIVNELVTNSFKYAFPDHREGEISIGLEHNGNGDFALVISDNGIGIPKDTDLESLSSLGIQLVMALTRQIEGDLELDRDNGTRFRISFKEQLLA
jgi:PAS domain S-box-containing protein